MINPFRRHVPPAPPPAPARDDALGAALAAIAAADTIEATLGALAAHARLTINCDGITLIERIGDTVRYMTEDAISPLWIDQSFPIRVCVSGQALLARAAIFIPDIAVDKRVPLNAYVATFVRSMGVVPIGRDDPCHALGAYWRDAQPIAPLAIERMTVLADAAARAIERLDRVPGGRQVA